MTTFHKSWGATVRALFFLSAICIITHSANAQILSYTNDVSGALNMVTTNATGTPMTRVNGAATPGAPCGSGLTVSAFTSATVYNTGLPAVEVTVTPDAGFTLNVTGFSAEMRRSGSGPDFVRFAYSTNGGITWIDQGINMLPNDGSCGMTAPGSWTTSVSVPAPLDLRLRLYGFGAASASGTLQLLNVVIDGSVSTSATCAIPPGLTATLVTSSSATLAWSAIPGALSYNVRYRPTGSSTWNFTGAAGPTTILSSLVAGTVYECEVETVCTSGNSGYSASTFFTTSAATVASASSGRMAVYFNRPVDTSVSTGEYAIYLNNAMADTLIAYLNRAKFTVDIAQYNYNQSTGYSSIADAINACIARGVRVRWIYDGHESNTGIALLDTAVHTLASPTTSTYGLMHNKVVIIDAMSDDPMDAVVSTGSTVWGVNQFNNDYNNTIFIQDSALAHAYLDHFNMMWGDTGSYPNPALSKFGPNKTDLGRHIFHIGGKTVELYFSPCDHTDAHIQTAINSANTDLYFGMFTFTMAADASAIVSRHTAGVYTPGIVDENSTLTSPAYPILTAGLGSLLKTHTGFVIYHNKMMTVDPSNTCSDPLVLTGSHNWTNAAETKNDENTLIIHNDTIANIYYQSFKENYSDMGGTLTPMPACTTASCGTPFGLTTTSVTTSTAILEWAVLSGAVSYTIHYRIAGTTTWSTTSSASNTITLTSLTPASIYEFEVQAVCVAGAGAYSSPATFTTPAPPCSIPSGLTISAIDTDIAVLSWVAVSGATGYNVQYREAGTTVWTTLPASTNTLTISGLLTNTSYEYQVQVLCSSGSSAYSSPYTFTTLASPAPVTCTAPGTLMPPVLSVATTSAVLRWAAVPGATLYQVRYHIAGTSTWLTTSSATNTVTVLGLAAGTTYEFQVRTVCTGGSTSSYGGSSLFVTYSSTGVTTLTPGNEAYMNIYPNPATEGTGIYYHLTATQQVTLDVCDMTGKVVAHTDAGMQSAGDYVQSVSGLAKGIYVVKLKAGATILSGKLVKL